MGLVELVEVGATGRNEELGFEAQGISLTQALARVGGLQDQRADPQGVFVFRFEDPAVFDAAAAVFLPPARKPSIEPLTPARARLQLELAHAEMKQRKRPAPLVWIQPAGVRMPP
jgi:hypothetical protein